MTRFIFVTGGVISSLGKGLTTASIGKILKQKGIKVNLLKIDPYLNVDPGTLSPYQHGEVFVTDDGSETDLDIGHYERFVDIKLTKINNFTTGQVYHSVIEKERNGDYGGKTVQVVPHVIDEIISRIKRAANERRCDVLVTELGGTIGDIESQPFTEAIREMKLKLNKEQFLLVHLVLVPYIKTAQEIKTKPAQHSVKKLNELGLQPDILIVRSAKSLTGKIKEKLSLFCNVEKENIVDAIDVDNIYKIPLHFKKQKLEKLIIKKFKLKTSKNEKKWDLMVNKMSKITKSLDIGLIGKYVELHDAYKSVIEALKHGGIANNVNINVHWVQSDNIINKGIDAFSGIKGILVPGGFGERGVEGKIAAINVAREYDIPFLGLCLGMQCAVIEYARNILKYRDANSTEFNPKTKHPVIDIIEDKRYIKQLGGTLRLGAYECKLKKNSLAHKIYKREKISERHRHRFEFNNKYKDLFVKNGLVLSGIYLKQNLIEIVELPEKRFFIGVQFHPEFKSTPENPHPLFKAFIKASL